MRVLLVYTREIPQSPDKPLVDFEAIQFGISYVSAYLKKHGHETRLIVLTRKSDLSTIDEYVEKFSPSLIGFTAVASEYPFVERIGKYIKDRYPDTFLLIGGVHVSLVPDDSMLDTFDALCVGEGEEATLDLIKQLEQGISPTGIPNLWIKRPGSIEKNPTRPYIEDLDSLPYPDRKMWEQWIDFDRSPKRPSILLGRGCPYNCTYCCNHAIRKLAKGRYVRFRSPENIIGEIEEVVDRFPDTKEFYCEVETFSAHWKWSLELCSRIEELNATRTKPLSFGVNIRITKDFVKRNIDEYFERLRRANFRFINIGLESGSERIRREVLKRDYSNEDLICAVETAKKYNLQIIFFNMLGLPHETLDDFHETVRMNQICLPVSHYLSIFYPYPGTDLHNLCEEMGALPEGLLDLELERISASMDFPEFPKEQIQKAFIWFNYYVYRGHRAIDFLARHLLHQYRLVYGQDNDSRLPGLIARDFLDPSLGFDERYQTKKIFWELVKIVPGLDKCVLSHPGWRRLITYKQVKPKTVKLRACSVDLGELHNLHDFGFFHASFHCITPEGDEFVARMRLRITEPMDKLIIVDPRAFADGGYAANSAGSPVLRRQTPYANVDVGESVLLHGELPAGTALFEISADEIKKALMDGYSFPDKTAFSDCLREGLEIAFVCHDTAVIGGGNIILYRYVNWLASLGVKVTIYSCGSPSIWTRVNAKFRCFESYDEMFSAIEEDIVILYSMWHIGPMLKAKPYGKRIYHLRQIAEIFHYGVDYSSMAARKPVIELLESLPIGVITVSPHLKDWYQRELGIDSLLITNGISLRTFYPGESRPSDSNILRVASVGPPTHFVKGADVLYAALRLLADREPGRKIQWTLASGLEITDMPKWFKEIDNLEVVTRAGLNRTQMREFYQSVDVFVNPSLYEGFGLPTLEAMACGVAVVHADNAGLDFIVEHGRDCLIVPINEPEAMADAIEKLFEDRELADRLVAHGKSTASKHTTADQFDHFISVFERILGTSFPIESVKNIRSGLDISVDKDITPDADEKGPLVSVVIPSYNQADYLCEALDSLLAQTYSHWEAIVVNDGSTDHTVEVMEKYAKRDSRVRPFSKDNGGITSALNYGLERAQGDFFCWLSSDDLFYPEKLEVQIKAYKDLDEDYGLLYGSFDHLFQEEDKVVVEPFAEPVERGAEFPEALKFDFIDGCTIMIPMKVMREIGGFNSYYRHSQDMELWVRIASRGYRFHLIDKKLTIRRVHLAQASTSNVIYCRYDAAWMLNYYLDHFHLLEMYRYFDLTKARDINRFVEHFVGRTLHTEANINHPLIQSKFWKWFDDGLAALPVKVQTVILKKCFNLLQGKRSDTYKTEFYIEECVASLSRRRRRMPFAPNFSVEGRDMRYDNRQDDPFAQHLFDYATDLLVNSRTPLFAQELQLHNCHKVVDTPYKLAHSALRYLSQFPNPCRDTVAGFADISQIPGTREQAIRLFCSLRYPDLTEAFVRSFAFDGENMSGFESVLEYEQQLARMPKPYRDDLRQVCQKNPTETILHYWNALTLAEEGMFAEALEEGWKTFTMNHNSRDWRIAYRLGVWAEKAGCFEKAEIAYEVGRGCNASFMPFTAGLNRLSQQAASSCQRMPTPKRFIFEQANREFPDAVLADFKIKPLFNGNFVATMLVVSENQQTFEVQGTLPYKPSFEDILITDPHTGKRLKVSANSIFHLWSGGYNFAHQSSISLRQLSGCHKVGVAFTIISSSVPGGGPMIIFRYVNWLAALGVDVAVYSNDDPPPGLKLNARFHRIPDEAKRYASITEPVVIAYSALELPALLRYCETEGKRIFHLCQGVEDFNYRGSTYASLIAPKAIFEILHSLPVGRLAVSPHIKDHFNRQYHQRTHTILNGIDLSVFPPRPKRALTDNITVIIVGNPHRLMKGSSIAKQALSLLAQKHPEWKLHLNIACGQNVHMDDARGQSVRGFTYSVHCGLNHEQMRQMYYDADIYINCSWYEGFGLPSLEAMACGVPVIQADNHGLNRIAADRQNCLVVPPQNPRKMARAFELLINDEKLRERLVENGLKTASKFSLTNQYDMFVEEFEKILVCKFDPDLVKTRRRQVQRDTLQDRLRAYGSKFRPLISVLVPTYNQAQYLKDALNSLRAQTYANWEAIVVNDGSTDDTPLIMEWHAARDGRFRLFHKDNGGVASALNEALRHARGEWICWLSSDDMFEPNRLMTIAGAAEDGPDIRFFHTHYSILDERTQRKGAGPGNLSAFIPPVELQVLKFFDNNYVNGISAAVHREVFEQVGGFNEEFGAGQDFEMWLRISALYRSHFLPCRTCVTRLHPDQGTDMAPGQILYDSPGIYDSARACLAFLNEHQFAELFPMLDLSDAEHARFAVESTLKVVAYPRSLINRCGFAPALVSRLFEWLTNSATAEIRSLIKPGLVRVTGQIQASNLPEEIKVAFPQPCGLLDKPFLYRCYDPVSEMARHTQRLEDSGETQRASGMKQYLAQFPTAPSEQITGTEQPLFSVLVPCYNQAKYLPAALDSLINQTYEHWEAIVVDDGSTDETSEVMARYAAKDKRIRTVRKENGGVASALNEGLRNANGQWICWLSCDDLFEPDKLRIHLQAIEENPNIRFFHTHYSVLYEEMGHTAPAELDLDTFIPSTQLQVLKLFEFNYVNGISVAIGRDVFEQVGCFNGEYEAGQDFDLWLRISSLYRSHFINKQTCITRVHPTQGTDVIAGTTVYDSRGVYDSARACLEFLNNHEFPALFPALDLSIPDQAVLAVKSTVMVVVDPRSFINRCGFAPALMDRLYEWLTKSAPEQIKMLLKPVLAQMTDRAQSSNLPEEIKIALRQSPGLLERPFQYRGYDPTAEMTRHVARLEESQREERASAMKQYVARFSTPPCTQVSVVDRPSFSIVVPCYNQAEFLTEALDSILNQSYGDWQAVVVDDGSTDETAQIMARYAQKDPRISTIHKENGGVASALNEGIRNAKGDWICWLSSDDFFEPDKLKVHAKYIKDNPDIRFFHTNYMIFNEKMGEKRVLLEDPREHVSPTDLQVLKYFERNCANGISVAIHRDVFDDVGHFDQNYRYGQDFDMWLRINARYRARFIDHKTVVSRWHNDRGTSEFPQAGFYDSCRACVEFMNAHRFTEYFPVIDLTSPDGAKRATTQTMLVAANLNAMMYKCYFNTVLLERLAHWLCQRCPEDLRQVLIPNLQAAVSKMTSRQVAGELRTALFQFSENIISDFRFRPHDFSQEAAQYAQKLAAAGQSERAGSIERYLSMIDSHKPGARQAAAETISLKKSMAVPPPDLRSEPRLHRKIESDHADSFHKPRDPLVSVVMPAYNAAAYIAKAIRSVLNQSRRNLELIVVDDGSDDGTKDIVANFNDDRVKYFYQDNAGASSARNLAINKANGPYIVILDADDMMTPDFVARHLDEFERNPQADLVYCDDSLIDEDDKPIRVIERPDYADTKLLIRDLFHCGYPVVPFRTCIRRSVFEKIGLYDESLLVGEDYDMVRRFVKCGLKAHHLKEALYLRRMKSDSLTAIHTAQKAKCHFDVVKRFADTFRYDELFPDVGWEKIPAEMRPLHAKCLMAVDCVAIGRTYIEVNSPIYARTAFDLACSQLNDCVRIAPYDPRIRQLLQQCKSVRTGFDRALQQGVS